MLIAHSRKKKGVDERGRPVGGLQGGGGSGGGCFWRVKVWEVDKPKGAGGSRGWCKTTMNRPTLYHGCR
jgi:hypothetical protein